MTSIGEILVVAKAKYWKTILPSGHTAHKRERWFDANFNSLRHSHELNARGRLHVLRLSDFFEQGVDKLLKL